MPGLFPVPIGGDRGMTGIANNGLAASGYQISSWRSGTGSLSRQMDKNVPSAL